MVTVLCLLGSASAGPALGASASLGPRVSAESTTWVPSLDFRAGRLLVQAHLLEQIARSAVQGEAAIYAGVDASLLVYRRPMPGGAAGVATLGPSVFLATTRSSMFESPNREGMGFTAAVLARLGVESAGDTGVGLYLAPLIGVTNRLDGVGTITYGGGVQVSAWFGVGALDTEENPVRTAGSPEK